MVTSATVVSLCDQAPGPRVVNMAGFQNLGAAGVELDGATYEKLLAAEQSNCATIRPCTVRELPPWRKLKPTGPQSRCFR